MSTKGSSRPGGPPCSRLKLARCQSSLGKRNFRVCRQIRDNQWKCGAPNLLTIMCYSFKGVQYCCASLYVGCESYCANSWQINRSMLKENDFISLRVFIKYTTLLKLDVNTCRNCDLRVQTLFVIRGQHRSSRKRKRKWPIKSFIIQASPLTVTVYGRQKSVAVSGELFTVSLYPEIFLNEGPIGGS